MIKHTKIRAKNVRYKYSFEFEISYVKHAYYCRPKCLTNVDEKKKKLTFRFFFVMYKTNV